MAFGQPQDPYAGYKAGFVDIPSPMAQAVKPKFFGEGGAGRTIAGLIGDALLQASGHQAVYSPLMAQMREHQQLLQEQEAQYQRQRADKRDDFTFKQEYRAAHPEAQQPTNYERELIAGGYQPGSPEFQARVKAHLDAGDDPIVTVPLPGNRIYSGPRSGLAAALGGQMPSAPVGNLTPIGGQTGSAPSGNFPR